MSSRKRKASQAAGLRETVRKLKRQKSSDLDDFLVIGIDFGTTYSGASWATIADFENNQINLVTTWPGTGREESKVPSELYYKQNQVMWGYSVPVDAEPLRWFKLLLLRDADLTPEILRSELLVRARKMLTEMKKTATDVIADYLRGVWGHILTTIERARSKSVVGALTFHVVITVPAIWPDYARSAMMEASRKAGIFDQRAAGETTLAFAPEPEAAALASLWDRAPDLKLGDVYVICDAGGGTVDLISYKVAPLDPIQLHEAVAGTGGLCGGIFIDELFEALCKSRLGRRWRNLSQAGIKDIMKHEWEGAVKSQFSPQDQTMEYIVAVPAEAFTSKEGVGLTDFSRKPHIKNGRIHFSSSDIQSAFDGALQDIYALVSRQISEARKKSLAVKGIILVGGLGSSPYLYQYLQTKYSNKGIEVLQSTGIRPRTAICRGAIFKGFLDGPTTPTLGAPSHILAPVSVVSTIARKSLGSTCYQPFQQGVHLEEDKFWQPVEGGWKAKGQITWYLRKGDDVSRKNPVRHEFYEAFTSQMAWDEKTKEGDTIRIYECNDDSPPTRKTKSVKKLCDIAVSFSGIKYDDLEEYYDENGRLLKKWSYDLEMVPSGASTEFAVYYKGKKLGSKNLAVDFQ